jgi:hypothetical protein
MVAPQRKSDLEQWIDISARLHPIQNLAVIGLMILRPNLPPSIIATTDPMDEENIRSTERWASSRFRQLFLFYCQHYKRPQARAAVEIIDKTEVVKGLAPLLVSTLSVPLGISVNFLFWALGYSLDEWCQKYGRRKYNGKGTYRGNFPGRKVDSFFDVTYLPPIQEVVEDPEAYPLEGYKIKIKVPGETNGKVKVPSSEYVKSVTLNFKGKNTHSFGFVDTQTNKAVGGLIENVFPDEKEGPNIIGFESRDLIVGESLVEVEDKAISEAAAVSEDYIQANPGKALLISAATGFVLGLLFSKSRR